MSSGIKRQNSILILSSCLTFAEIECFKNDFDPNKSIELEITDPYSELRKTSLGNPKTGQELRRERRKKIKKKK